MLSTTVRVVLAGLTLFALGGSAAADEYRDKSGFSLTYPEGWTAVTGDSLKDVEKRLPAELKEYVIKSEINFDKVAVVILRNGKEDYLENLNVVVVQQEMPINNKSLQEIAPVILKQFEAAGIKVSNVQQSVKKVGTQNAIVLEYETMLPGNINPKKQRQVMFSGAGKSFVITCSANVDSMKTHQATFNKILASFKLPPAKK